MGLRARLLLLVLLPAIPALLLALYTNLELRRLGAARVEKDAMRVAQLAAENQSGLIVATRQHLTGLSHLPQARGNDLMAFDVFFAGMPKIYTAYTDFGLIETNGDLVSSSFGRKAPTNLINRPCFQRVLKSHDLAIGDYQAGDGTDKPSLPFAYPILDEKGQFVRVLYAALDLVVLNRTLAKAQIPEGGVIEVFDRSGHVLARSPKSEEWVGKSFSDSSLFSTIAAKKEGTIETGGLDGVPRLFAFANIGGESLFVSVGIPTSLAYANTQHILVVNLAILGAVTLVALIAARSYANKYILHPVNTLASTAGRVAAGDLSARTGIAQPSGELNRLALAFDAMTSGLQQQRNETERSAQALRESEHRFRQLADAMPQIVWTARPDGSLDYCNERWYQFTGIEKGASSSENWTSILHPDDVQRSLDCWHAAVKSGETYQIEYRFREGRTGLYRWHLGRALPVRDEAGEIAQWFGTSTDIDDQKRVTEEARNLNATLESRVTERTAELEGANRELEAFSYSVAHDLRTPLRHIDGYVNMLQDELGSTLTEKGRRCLKTISAAAKKMGVLIDDLLAFSHMSRTELWCKLVSSDDLINAALQEIKRDTEGRNIQWEIEAMPQVFADQAMLRQVWANLLSNAVKYTGRRERAEIKIGYRSSESEFEFYVRDNGAGFNMLYAAKLFGVFQRLHREDEFEGTGIGLANVRRIIHRHGGRTWAEGEVDKGATFFFSLPRNKS